MKKPNIILSHEVKRKQRQKQVKRIVQIGVVSGVLAMGCWILYGVQSMIEWIQTHGSFSQDSPSLESNTPSSSKPLSSEIEIEVEEMNESEQLVYLLSFDLELETIQALKTTKGFKLSAMPNYETFLKQYPNATPMMAIEFQQHPYIMDSFYEHIETVSQPSDPLVLVNKNFKLPANYQPLDLMVPNVLSWNHETQATPIYVRADAKVPLEKLFQAAYEERGYVLYVRSGFRSYETQYQLYQRYVNQHGQTETDTFSARAGHSEHQTGWSIDITSDSVNRQLTTEFGETLEGKWVTENAHRFGFIIRYPLGREEQTGYQYEPWHLRYVGIEAATEMYENQWLLEEYWLHHQLLNSHSF